MVYLILQTGRELNLVIKWGGGKLWFFAPLDPRGLFDYRGGKCVFFLSLSTTLLTISRIQVTCWLR